MTDGCLDAVVFDFGGVFTASPFEAAARMGELAGIAPERAVELVLGPYDDDTDHPWHRAERGELDIHSCRREIRELSAAAGAELDLWDLLGHMSEIESGVREVVVDHTRRLRAEGLRTGLLTNNVAEAAAFWRPMLPLEELFDDVVDSCEVGMRKPDERIYRLALERLGGVPPERTAFLDDWSGNIDAARRIGMHGIVVERDPTRALAELDVLLGW